MGKRRVLQLVPDFSLGGAERLVAHLIGRLDPDRFEVVAISLYDALGTDLDEMLARDERDVRYLGKRRGFDPAMVLKIDRVVRSLRPHVMHTHTIALRYALPSMLLRRVPARLHTIHSLADKEAGSWRRLRKFAFRRGVVPVAIADEVQASVERVYGIRDCPNIANGIPLASYRNPAVSRADWRANEGLAEDDVVFVTVGRLVAHKNHALLLDAFRTVAREAGRARCLIVGEEASATLRSELDARARALGIESQVRFTGPRHDIPDLLGAADVFVLSSEFEGNPLTVMEAMAAGKPVVSTAVGGVPQLVEDGVSGLLVQPGDATALAGAMLRLVDSPTEREAMGLAASQRATERFDVDEMARAYERLYESLIDRPDRGRTKT